MELAAIFNIAKASWKIWAPILLAIVAYFFIHNYIEGVREQGRQTGLQQQYTVDKAAFDKAEKERNDKIDKLEAKAKTLADNLDLLNSKATQTIANLNKQLVAKQKELDQTRYGADGKAVTSCTDSTTLYLGLEFSKDWNQYNKGVLVK